MSSDDRAQGGFTIIELLIAVAVSAIASMLIMSSFVYTYGAIVAGQIKTTMTLESQLFLRRMTDDIRVANQIRATNQLEDAYGPVGGWITSDPANILITTEPATDEDEDFVYDDATGYPYQHEVVYFGSGGKMYRRLITNDAAFGHDQTATCPDGVNGCPPDIELVGYLDNMLFEFYDIDDQVTADPVSARSIEVTINLSRKAYGKNITTTNSTRVTLRNEN